MRRTLLVLVMVAVLYGRAVADGLTTQHQTFLGAQASLAFPGGTPQCDKSTSAVDTLTLPKSTLAPASAATQLAWTPSGNQTSAYEIAVIDPSGGTAATWTIGANSKDQVLFFKAGAAAGPWSFRESGLPSSSCSGGTLIGSPGSATGTAAWYQ